MNLYNTTWKPSDKPTVLYFTAGWCVPCRRFGPVMDQVEQHVPDVEFLKVDADEFFEITGTYAVKSLPTLVYLQDERAWPEYLIGAKSADEVLTWLEETS